MELAVERLGVKVVLGLSVSLDRYKGLFPPFEAHNEFLCRVFDRAVRESSPEIVAQAQQFLAAFEAAILRVHREEDLALRENGGIK